MRFRGVTVTEVDHPGVTGRPFIRPAADAGFTEAIAAYTRKLRERLTRHGLNTPGGPTP